VTQPQEPFCYGPARRDLAAFVRQLIVRPGITRAHLLVAAEALEAAMRPGNPRAAAADLRHMANLVTDPARPEPVEPERLVLRGRGVTALMLREAAGEVSAPNARMLLTLLAVAAAIEERGA
jgi:hypothetical protein